MTGQIEDKLTANGIVLPDVIVLPGKNRRSAVQVGQILYMSGHGSALLADTGIKRIGRVGNDVTLAEAREVARAVAISMLATIKHHVGDLDRIKKVVKITGMINAVPDFEHHNKVLDGASDFFFELFGPEIGQHARSSMGVGGLVARQSVEIEGIFHIKN